MAYNVCMIQSEVTNHDYLAKYGGRYIKIQMC